MKRLQYICVQPRLLYYAWQVEVMINNFICNGINPNDINILVAWNPDDLTNIEENIKPWKQLYENYKDVNFYEYEDKRLQPIHYISSIRPNILKQHFQKYPELSKEVFFYHDCDILFTKPVDFSELVNDNIWYLSDTKSYINYDYIKSKSYGVYEEMCRIVGIDEEIPRKYNDDSGGAQYIMKNLTWEYWEKVERDSEELFRKITEKNNRIKQQIPSYHELQIWCADMWSVLWNAWLFGYDTKIVKEMDFCWANEKIDKWDICSIFHNAGVASDGLGYFYKSNYMNKQPYDIDIKDYDSNYCSYKYVENIIQTKNNKEKLEIKKKFNEYKIVQLQLDPYGVCNAKCWFCPVRYNGNPQSGKEVMSVELLKKIIKNIIEERDKEDGLVHKNFSGFYTAHYNEILLYPHFEDLLKICKEYRLHFMVLSNGIPLTPERVDLINKYRPVVNGICLNIPAFEPEIWSLRSGINIKQFDKLISNVKYAMKELPDMVLNKSFSIQINGSNEQSFSNMGGWLDKGPDFPNDMDLNTITGELQNQLNVARNLFEGLQIFAVPSLIDRAGLLDNVMTNKHAINRNLQMGDEKKRVIGCGNGREVGGRPIGWIHINSTGKAFLCCNDYDMEVQFGDFKTQTLKDFWGTEEHINKIHHSYNTICRKCASAIYE